MTREDQIRKVERGFSDLVSFAEDSWSNLAIVAKVRALRAEVVSLYHWQDPVQPEALKKQARKSPHRQPKPPPVPPEPFEPVEIDETTRWG